MKYKLNEIQVNKAKKMLKSLKDEKKKWVRESEKVTRELASTPKKYYNNVRVRLSQVDSKVKRIETNIQKFKEAIKNGYIEV